MGKLTENPKIHIINECKNSFHHHQNKKLAFLKLDRQISNENENSVDEKNGNPMENLASTITDQSISRKLHLWRKTKKLSSAAARISCTKSSIKLNKKRLYKLDQNFETEKNHNELSPSALPSSSADVPVMVPRSNSKKLIDKIKIKHDKRKIRILRLNGSNRKFWPFLKTIYFMEKMTISVPHEPDWSLERRESSGYLFWSRASSKVTFRCDVEVLEYVKDPDEHNVVYPNDNLTSEKLTNAVLVCATCVAAIAVTVFLPWFLIN